MWIKARGIDPLTGEADRHGIPQIACPARQGDVNPQFTCRDCPCARQLEMHQAIDDRGDPFYIVDAVQCDFDRQPQQLVALWRSFPSLLEGLVENPPPRVEPGVACPLLSWPDRTAPLAVDIDGVSWAPEGNCRSCQFYRGSEGNPTACSLGEGAGVRVVCSAPLPPAS